MAFARACERTCVAAATAHCGKEVLRAPAGRKSGGKAVRAVCPQAPQKSNTAGTRRRGVVGSRASLPLDVCRISADFDLLVFGAPRTGSSGGNGGVLIGEGHINKHPAVMGINHEVEARTAVGGEWVCLDVRATRKANGDQVCQGADDRVMGGGMGTTSETRQSVIA